MVLTVRLTSDRAQIGVARAPICITGVTIKEQTERKSLSFNSKSRHRNEASSQSSFALAEITWSSIMTDQNPTNPSSSPSSLGKPSPSTQGVAATMPSSAQQSPTPSSLNPVAPAFGTDGRILAQPGHIWLSAKQGQAPWPVVICDEQMLQILWKGVQRPENARMADGRWPKEYRPGGKLEGRVAFPTMRLGTMKL